MTNQIICSKCVMDKSAEEIIFDENGVCNFCVQAEKVLKEIELEKPNLSKWIKKIKESRCQCDENENEKKIFSVIESKGDLSNSKPFHTKLSGHWLGKW